MLAFPLGLPKAVTARINAQMFSAPSLLIVLAGSNGAGKSTFHNAFVRSGGLPFVNADEIQKQMRARFPRTLKNALAASAFVDWMILIDHDSQSNPYRAVAALHRGERVWRARYRPVWAHEMIRDKA